MEKKKYNGHQRLMLGAVLQATSASTFLFNSTPLVISNCSDITHVLECNTRGNLIISSRILTSHRIEIYGMMACMHLENVLFSTQSSQPLSLSLAWSCRRLLGEKIRLTLISRYVCYRAKAKRKTRLTASWGDRRNHTRRRNVSGNCPKARSTIAATVSSAIV